MMGAMLKEVAAVVFGGVVGGVVRNTEGSTTGWSAVSYGSLVGRLY
jgi:hypothetical protein